MLFSRLIRGTEGATAVMTAISILTAVGSMALAIDLGHLYVVKSELQRAADAGALAAAQGLLNLPPGTSGPVPMSSTIPDCARATNFAQNVVQSNTADGGNLSLPLADVTFGAWDQTAKVFNPIGCANPNLVNAVRVVTRKDTTANNPVPLYFAGILPGGSRNKDLTATAIGIIGPPVAGKKTFPLAVDADKVPPNNVPFRIHLNPSPGDDGCWHTYKDNSSSTSDIRDYITGDKPSPELRVGDQINVKEGVSDSALKEIGKQSLPYDVLVPIIPANSSHSGWQPVEGFATLRITDVVSQGSPKYVEGYIVPDFISPNTEPGGPNYGTMSPYARIVY